MPPEPTAVGARLATLGTSKNLAILALAAAALLVTGAANPRFVTSDPNGGWPDGGYYVHNNMWNSAKYSPCSSTLYAWSHDNWYVVTRMNNQDRRRRRQNLPERPPGL